MSRDLEQRIGEVLQLHADRPVTVGSIIEDAVVEAKVARRRRRITTGIVAACVVGAVTAGSVSLADSTLLPRRDAPAASRSASPQPPEYNGPTTLPRIAGTGALDHPEAVGTDPGRLHFDVDAASLNATYTSWISQEGLERVIVSDYDHGKLGWDATVGSFYLGREALVKESVIPGDTIHYSGTDMTEPAPKPVQHGTVDIHGRPARLTEYPKRPGETQSSWVLLWQPKDGLWAAISAKGPSSAAATGFIPALRLNVTQRCAVPARIAALPAGLTWDTCNTGHWANQADQRLGVWNNSSLTFLDPAGKRYLLMLAITPSDPAMRAGGGEKDRFTPNEHIAGHPAMWKIEGNVGELIVQDWGVMDVSVNTSGSGGAAHTTCRAILEQLTLVGDLHDPATWPVRAVG